MLWGLTKKYRKRNVVGFMRKLDIDLEHILKTLAFHKTGL